MLAIGAMMQGKEAVLRTALSVMTQETKQLLRPLDHGDLLKLLMFDE